MTVSVVPGILFVESIWSPLHSTDSAYTKYHRDHAIFGDILGYDAFHQQVKKTDLCVGSRAMRLSGKAEWVVIPNYEMLRQRVEITGFGAFETPPLSDTEV